ncbi:MAG: hypothetical protein K6U88_07290 [Dehalococcoidia bacterium]|nr:hypothetical protein [Dehalococcoidia bacterium]
MPFRLQAGEELLEGGVLRLPGSGTERPHEPADVIAAHAALAADLGMAASGGSDYHGLGNPDDRDIGDIPFPDDRVDAFVRFIDANCACGAMEGAL